MKDFNLTTEKWIPCITLTQERNFYSLREVFSQAPKLREVYGETPLVTLTLYRFLLALLHSIPSYKMKEPHEWLELWKKEKFEEAEIFGYLDQWDDRFWLFHDKYPFYQDIRTATGKPFGKRITEVMHEIASGNNAAWFDHTLEPFETEYPGKDCASAARAVLSAQSFGITGRDSSGGYQSFGPLMNDVVFIIQGNTLFETLMLNLYLYENQNPLPEKDDRPIWEHETPLEQRRRITLGNPKDGYHPGGYLDLLTWPSRRILLRRDEDGQVRLLKMEQGWKLCADEAINDPMKAYKDNMEVMGKGKKKFDTPGKIALVWDENRAVWRDSNALFRIRAEFDSGNTPKGEFESPMMIANLRKLLVEAQGSISINKRYHCVAFGICASQASVQFFRAEYLPLPLAYLLEENKELVGRLDDVLKIAEKVGIRLKMAVRKMSDSWLQPNKETQAKESESAMPESDLDDWLAGFDESQFADKEKEETKRDEDMPQRKGMRLGAERRYWANVGEHFYKEMTDLAQKSPKDKQGLDEFIADWKRKVWQIARQAYEESANMLGRSPRALKAYAIGYEVMEGKYKPKKEAVNEPTR